MFLSIIKLIRVKQWIKNGFMFLPLFFGQKLFDLDCLLPTILGFISYSFFASSIYVLNDYMDREKDRLHPKKKFRPIASGAISPKSAVWIMIILFVTALIIALFLRIEFLFIVMTYTVLNLAYSVKLKHIAIIDITIISIGFVLRVLAGAVICQIIPTVWLIMMTFLLALFIALAKRRDDVLIYLNDGTKTRAIIEQYNLQFLNIAMSIMASVIIVAYLMYALSAEVRERLGTDYLYVSVFFVILGILRYLQVTLVEEDSGSPTELIYKDSALKIIILGWIATIILIIYIL